MGIVIPFSPITRASAVTSETPDTPPARRARAEAHTRATCARLLQYYQSLGTWSPACESHMVTAVRALMTVCHHLTPISEVPRGDNDEKV